MRNLLSFFLLFYVLTIHAQVQTLSDNFEGSGNINNWYGDGCFLDSQYANPHQIGINNSATVLQYSDTGGQYANVRFDAGSNFNLTTNSTFTLKVYVPSASITGGQLNQISLKLQNGSLSEPWSTQCEIIKPIVLDQWQVLSFDFANDAYVNLNPNAANPVDRFDFNRVLLQLNGENNNAHVTCYIDDFQYNVAASTFNNLVWSDEFDGNGAINSNNWFYQTQLPSGGSWHNGELQHYTNRPINSYLSNGVFNIVAKKEVYYSQGQTKQYTSARVNSKFAFKYGRVEVRAKLPIGAGTWPAIWMLGKNVIEPGSFWSSSNGTVYWPACGEIDIMEHWGNNQNYVQSAMHTPSSFGGTVNRAGQTIPTASNQFHIYSLEWTADRMVFSVDNVVHYIYNPSVKNANTWPFDAQQYILLNVAIEPSVTPNFAQSAMEVDYVRVFQQTALATVTPLNKDAINLYPNPFEDRLTITGNTNILGSQVKIYSILGQQLQSFLLKELENSLDLSDLQNGIYLIKIETQNGSNSFRVIKN